MELKLRPTGEAMMTTGEVIVTGELMAPGEAEQRNVQTMLDGGLIVART